MNLPPRSLLILCIVAASATQTYATTTAPQNGTTGGITTAPQNGTTGAITTAPQNGTTDGITTGPQNGTTGGITTGPQNGTTGGITTGPQNGTTGGITTAPQNGTTDAITTAPQNGTTGATSTAPQNGTTGATSTAPQNGTTGATSTAPQNGTTGATSTAPQNGTTDATTTAPQNGTTGGITTAPQNGTTGGITTAPQNGTTGAITTAPQNGTTGAITTGPQNGTTGAITTAPQNGTTSTAPQNGTTDTTASTPATVTKGPCSPNPCIGNGICEERFGGVFVCVCRPGLVYSDTQGCNQAKVFPSTLALGYTYQESMSVTTSELFKETSDQIQKQLRDTLTGNGYLDSIVLSLNPSNITRSQNVMARVQNFYEISSNATEQSVGEQIDEGIKDGRINATNNKRMSVCTIGYCDSNTTNCEGDGTAVCTCKSGYVSSQFTDQACIACASGEKAVDGVCKKCMFGFSGFNCNDPYLLVVVVVSCVLGTLVIVFMVALIVVSCGKQKKSSRSNDFSPYGNMEMRKPAGVPRIPRANPNSGYQTENLEVTNNGSTQSLMTKDQQDNKPRYPIYDNDNMRHRNQDPTDSGMENGLRGVQNPYYRQDYDSMRRY